MCGIFGAVGKKLDKYDEGGLKPVLSSLSKRGPDGNGILFLPSVVLGHTRLSIVDLKSGAQPMKDGGKNTYISFNGEIYNYKELKKELIEKGHQFITESDTEVILKSYAEYGTDCLSHLDGMFAFALWDEKKQVLFLARDRFGKKPLYYTFDKDGNFLIASEIKALFAAGIKGEVDPEAIDNYLTLMYIPPWKTVYKNIHVIPPAHAGIFEDGKIKIWKYWELEEKPIKDSYAKAREKIKNLFEDSVKKRMVADVEIGSLLSGGVDSTLVSAYAQKFSKTPIKTFSVGYGEHINELPYAKEASEKIGTDHYTIQAGGELIKELEKVIEYMDEPHADSSNFPQHILSELASSKVKVALSGDGADELFMGYGWYWKYDNTKKIVRVKNAIFSNRFKEHIKNISVFSKAERKKLWNDKSALNDDFIGKNIKKINLFDLSTYLPGQLLSKVDRTSMMHSLEVRCPFLDYRLAEYVYNLPENYKMKNGMGKIMLKDILLGIMPEEFVNRKKQGFGAPIKEWLREKKTEKFVIEALGVDSPIYKYLKNDVVGKIISSFYAGKDDSFCYKVWSILCLSLWLKHHGKYHVSR
ncbi:asparagine synthase (glutamine-hydrolyzing) [Candidatus Roizmanbacteria bacterium RIFCSPHIGHO2_01_FULL_39_12c]|uniref:asparagine synthase (glutamine-hydrolyzing) n=1 Tax=Candidatus Roizmanbacteria bacterium RIFCSPHIGHO2_01_FULL_39_12c TaxID=1802031 RepID=A0A1F7GD38_9BACT|nr:MAG: asparagine synthase (glutamine-hydrolyzing) [Candidatus Roizmanbacteria bacterium RIFCSPHIGHO2_01_FULL_39_12c]